MMKILVIDDDPDVRTVLELVMKKEGFAVQTASKKEEVFEKLQQFHPQVILLDVLLSGADGRDVCREIKSMDAFREVPVVMVSAHPGAGENFKDYGASDFVTKPIRTEQLLEMVRRLASTTGN